jgi:hypothetical protein
MKSLDNQNEVINLDILGSIFITGNTKDYRFMVLVT